MSYELTEQDIKELEIKKELILEKRQESQINNSEDVFEIFALRFIKKYPCYYDNNNILFAYDVKKNKWVKSDERDLICIAKNLMDKSGLNNSNVRGSFTNAILDRARWNKPDTVPKEWVHFDNCFYDIETKTRISPDRKYFSQIKIPHKLGLTTDTPIIDAKIKSWVGEDQYNLFLQICAFCMYKSYPFARFFIFYGTGQDGKSTAGDFITRLIGDDNSCNVDIDSLHSNRFEAQKMYQKTLAVCGEVDYKLLKNTRALKGVTGGDPLTIEFKNKDPFTYRNFAKLLWYANGVPPTYDKTQGFYRRTIILKFPNKFKENSNPLGDITEEEYENFCLKCIISLKDLLDNGFDEKSLEDKTREYEELSNPVLKFINTYTEMEAGEQDFLMVSEMYNAYLVFAKRNSYRNFNYKEFTSMLKAENIEFTKLRFYQREDNGDLDRFKDDFTSYLDKDIRRQCILNCKFNESWESREVREVKFHSEPRIGNLSENRVPRVPSVPQEFL